MYKRAFLASQDGEYCEEGGELTEATQLDERLVVVKTNTVVRPHAMVIHHKHAHVANTTVMRAKRLDKLALVTECIFLLRQLSHGVLKCFEVCTSYRGIPQDLCDVPRVSFCQIFVNCELFIMRLLFWF